MKFRMLALLGLLVLAWTEPAFAQLPPPQPVGPAALEGQTKITASTSSSRVALPSTEPNAKAVTIYNSGSTDAYFVLGNSSVTATSSNTLIKAGTYITVWRDTNTHLAAISASSTDDLIIYQGNGVLQFGQVGGGSGGGGSGTVTNVATGNGLTGGPITGTGTISTTEALGNGGAAITATTYNVSPTNDAAKQLLFTGSSSSAWDDAGTGTTAAGLGFDIVNAGTANVTYTPAAGIDGTASLVVPFGSWAHVFFDGTTWRSEPGKNLSGVTAGTYGDSTHCVSVTVDKYGRLTAASQSTSCPGAGAPPPVKILSGRWYTAAPMSNAGTHQNANTIWYTPIYLPVGGTMADIGGYVSTLQAGGNAQFQMYALDPATNKPTGAPLCSSNISQSTAATGNISAACGATFTAGHWFLASNQDNNVATLESIPVGSPFTTWMVGADSMANIGGSSSSNVGTQWTSSVTFGTWPTNPTVTEAKFSFAETPNLYAHIQ